MMAAIVAAACGPALDWRQLRPPDWHLAASLPCRPDRVVRSVPLAGQPVEMTMLACSVGEHTFALASVPLTDPAAVPAALRALVDGARTNVGGAVERQQPAAVPGMTPQADARRLRVVGHRPDGRTVTEELVVFAHGLRVFQATVLGPKVDAVTSAPFFDGLVIEP